MLRPREFRYAMPRRAVLLDRCGPLALVLCQWWGGWPVFGTQKKRYCCWRKVRIDDMNTMSSLLSGTQDGEISTRL